MAAPSLSPDQKRNLEAMALEGFTIKEVSETIGCSYSVAQRHGTAARKRAGLGVMVRANCADVTQQRLEACLRQGMTSYQAAIILNRTSAALRRYAVDIYEKLRNEGITCPCGNYLGHRGGCEYRSSLLMPREVSWYRKNKMLGPVPTIEQWAKQRDPLYAQIDSQVTKGIAADIRDDIISDVYVAVLSGALETASLGNLIKRAKSKCLDQWADSFRTKSLDMVSGDDFNLYKVLAGSDGREIDNLWNHNPWLHEERIDEIWE